MNPAAALGDATRFGEIRGRLLFLIGALIVYRIGTFIPVPGIDPERVASFFNDQSDTILGVVNMFSGGALERLSIFAMGVMPYISASIIIQMMSMVVPSLMEYRKEGESGRRKITQLTRYFTLLLGAFQSFAAAVTLQNNGMVLSPGFTWLFTATITMTTGTMFLMWLGEQITERGVGNGISMIILVGIIAGLPGAVGRTVEQVNTGEMQGPFAILLLAIIIGVTAFCVYVERAQRRITVNYAKRQVGRRMYAGQTSHLPFKLNMAGVIPPIFASSLLLFPATIASFLGTNPDSPVSSFLQQMSAALSYGQPLHMAAVRRADHLLLLLLHGAGVQRPRYGRQPEEVRCVHPGHPPGPADRRVHRQGADPADAVGRAVHRVRLPRAGDADGTPGRAVPVRRHVAADRRRGGDGLHRAAAGSCDVAPVPGFDEEGQPAGRWPQWCRRLTPCAGWRRGIRNEGTTVRQEDLQELQDRAPSGCDLRDLLGHASQAAPGLSGEIRWHA